ncbi:unnamed protein product [Oncorhynchus mykiss]|uniref:Uncharacterized protein n=1 Tax=Oncorhynchus mykiss TaxID=8022 RepID=A0A060WTN5_ONCMY|nr:unnamed protein product [Oncorhynchus mykiss]
MNLIKTIVKNEAYKPCKNIEDSKPESLEAHKIKTAFFTHPTLTEIGRRLVSHYFLLTKEELAMWEEDPEGFAVEETGGDSWKYSLRYSALRKYSAPLNFATFCHISGFKHKDIKLYFFVKNQQQVGHNHEVERHLLDISNFFNKS